ncbi:P-loop containing nucleoside triphosphate hydrolase protein, partial [Haematococcus lacustris]
MQEYGLRYMKLALSSDDSPLFLTQSVVPFLAKLGHDSLTAMCRKPLLQVLDTITTIPGLLPSLGDTITSGNLPDATPVAWFALTLAINSEAARANPELEALVQPLLACGGGAAVAARQLKQVLSPAGALALEDLRAQAGGRHDNDAQNFRDIKIIPTSEEHATIQTGTQPTLQEANDVNKVGDEAAAGSLGAPEAMLLDRHFRLLREDMVGTLREVLRTLAAAAASSTSTSSNVYRQVSVLGVCKQPKRPVCIMLSFALPPGHHASGLKTQKEKEDFWDRHGRGILPLNALVCLAAPGGPLLFGTVVRREPEEMAEAQPLVGVSFEAGRGLEKVLAWSGKTLTDTVLVQVSTNLLSIRPVLEGLQALPTVPLAEELVYGQPSQRPSYLSAAQVEAELEEAGKALDPSQVAALEHGLSQRVALIQGPPGTGKTFIGAMLCDNIVRHSQETILCVCYTNHALDQFLEALLDKGIEDIVRIGGGSKSSRLAPYNVLELSEEENRTTSSARRFGALQQSLTRLDRKEDEYQARRSYKSNSSNRSQASKSQPQPQPQMPPSLWDVLAPFIKAEQPEAWLQLGSERVFHEWRQGKLTPNAKPKPISLATLRRTHHKPQAEPAPEPDQGSLWQLSRSERAEQLRAWTAARQKQLCEDVAACMQKVDDEQTEQKALRNSGWEDVLKGARVIGCTVTGAASHKALLDALQPGVLLVEEAGELLEAHVLTSLSTKTKHLVLIGDHKQLRPKVESYSLQKESGRGYDLNVSLFERLVLAGFPHASLAVQHRMHPDISRLVRPTYPALHDHPSVAQHPAVKGLGQHRLVFIHHEVPEDGENSNSGWHASKMQQSKVNSHEVGMVQAVVTYLLQQGYAKEQLVVLTPYLGQLLELKQDLSDYVGVSVNEKDMEDLQYPFQTQLLANLGVENKDKQQGSGGVRVATIDNYQGEELDIVVASLVRSNSAGKVGFLKEPERINVLLSRARHGMIL